MEFCPECGMRMILTKQTETDESRPFLSCPKCGYKRQVNAIKPTFTRTSEHSTTEQIAVIDNETAKIRTMPTTKTECPKCGNREAFWWMVQTRGADESTTQFFRCTQCNYTWREMA